MVAERSRALKKEFGKRPRFNFLLFFLIFAYLTGTLHNYTIKWYALLYIGVKWHRICKDKSEKLEEWIHGDLQIGALFPIIERKIIMPAGGKSVK